MRKLVSPALFALLLFSCKSAMYKASHLKLNSELKKLSRIPTPTGCLYQPAAGLDSIRPKVPRL